ncbi:MAG: 3-dehydroquinate synthase family protein [Candidatus Magasanikbacteria bacterium]
MNYKKITANFGNRSYTINYGNNIIQNLGKQMDDLGLTKSVTVVTHSKLKKIYGDQISYILKKTGRKIHWIFIPQGEVNKNLESVQKLYTEFIKARIDKSSSVIAFGGGMLQDLVCYSAATYLRGVPFIQIPTTVLSQADIGVGGCAIDHPSGKSLIGTFYQPKLVLIDTKFISTLPEEEIQNGIAEIINKVVCLGGKNISTLYDDIPKLILKNEKMMLHYITQSNLIKLSIIEKDETGLCDTRMILDFGHTLTYALERATNYTLKHGFALGIGMRMALLLSEQFANLSKKTSAQVLQLIKRGGLPIHIPL